MGKRQEAEDDRFGLRKWRNGDGLVVRTWNETAAEDLDELLFYHKHGQSLLYTSVEIIDCIPQRGGGLYAVCTSSKSHHCCPGTGRCPKRPVGLGR